MKRTGEEDSPDYLKSLGGYTIVLQASSRQLLKTGDLKEIKRTAYEKPTCCDLCAHPCRTDRLHGRIEVCGVDNAVQISNYGTHFGKEDVLVGRHGLGEPSFLQ